MRKLALLLFACLSVLAQEEGQFVLSQQFLIPAGEGGTPYAGYPTNQDGYPVYTWYPVHQNVDTNVASFRWTNCSSQIDALNHDLTNYNSGTQPAMQRAAVNGKDALYFDGVDDWMYQRIHTNNLPCEQFICMSITNEATLGRVFDGALSGYYNSTSVRAGSIGWSIGSATITATVATNTWIVWDIVSSASGTTIYSNNISYASITNVPTDRRGLFVMCDVSKANNKQATVGELITYQTNLTSTVRSNIYSYLTNKYAITP